MDIPRPSAAKDKRRKRIIIWGGVGLGIIVITILLGQLKPAAPTVERNLVWIDSVKEGPMVRQVRGLGTLVPQDIRFIAARTNGRVDRILLRPGANVEPDTVLMILVNPDVEQAALNSELQLAGSLAELEFLRSQVERGILEQEASSARVKSEYEQARLQEEVNTELHKEGLVATVILKQSQVAAEEAATRWSIEQKRLELARKSVEAQIAPKEAEVSRLRSQAELAKRDYDALTVRASYAGVLQALP
ncbi:MAG TPA: RND transporter, partial [Opitutaceae bacterium]